METKPCCLRLDYDDNGKVVIIDPTNKAMNTEEIDETVVDENSGKIADSTEEEFDEIVMDERTPLISV